MIRIHKFVGSISAFAGILLIIYIAINGILIQESFLNGTNKKYNVHKNLSMTQEELQKAVHGMVAYVRGEIENPQVVVEIKENDVEFYNQKELGHLADVRALIKNLNIMAVALAVICIAGEVYLFIKKNYEAMGQGILWAWAILAIAVAGIGILALIDIDLVVTGFHRLCFSNNNWVLNPAKDRSVWMFRTNMYGDVLIMIAGIVGAVALISLALFQFLRFLKDLNNVSLKRP